MKITLYTAELNNTEKKMIEGVYCKLLNIAAELKNYDVIASPATGECIEIEELSRAAGILGGLIENELWEVM